jgi:hypothetical protein
MLQLQQIHERADDFETKYQKDQGLIVQEFVLYKKQKISIINQIRAFYLPAYRQAPVT